MAVLRSHTVTEKRGVKGQVARKEEKKGDNNEGERKTVAVETAVVAEKENVRARGGEKREKKKGKNRERKKGKEDEMEDKRKDEERKNKKKDLRERKRRGEKETRKKICSPPSLPWKKKKEDNLKEERQLTTK